MLNAEEVVSAAEEIKHLQELISIYGHTEAKFIQGYENPHQIIIYLSHGFPPEIKEVLLGRVQAAVHDYMCDLQIELNNKIVDRLYALKQL